MRLRDEQLEEVTRKLRERGYRLTPQRMAIIKAILSSKEHPTAEEIYNQLVGDFPMLSLATVYKTLDVLKDLGLVMEIKVEGAGYYDSGLIPHPHLICVKCHRIEDLPPETMCLPPEEILLTRGFKPIRVQLEIYGLCSRCQEQA